MLVCALACLIYLLLIIAFPANAEIFSYTDEKGQTHYVDSEQKIPERYKSKAAPSKLPEISAVTPGRKNLYDGKKTSESSVGFAAVEVFVTDVCPYCQVLERELAEAGIKYQRYNIASDKSAAALFRKLGGRGVPLTRVNGATVISGAQIEEIKAALAQGSGPGRST